MVALHNDQLDYPISRVRDVLNDDYVDHESDWVDEIRHAQEDLVQALRQHVIASESSNGSLATLAGVMHGSVATVDRRVRQLRKEHVDLLTNANELMRYISVHYDEVPEIHHRCSQFLGKLETHKECECNFFVDIMTQDEPGGGD